MKRIQDLILLLVHLLLFYSHCVLKTVFMLTPLLSVRLLKTRAVSFESSKKPSKNKIYLQIDFSVFPKFFKNAILISRLKILNFGVSFFLDLSLLQKLSYFSERVLLVM